MICERCSDETYKLNKCEYCGRKLCKACEKSSKKPEKVRWLMICRDCWGDLKKRRVFKRA